jgi:hypothetical protein
MVTTVITTTIKIMKWLWTQWVKLVLIVVAFSMLGCTTIRTNVHIEKCIGCGIDTGSKHERLVRDPHNPYRHSR